MEQENIIEQNSIVEEGTTEKTFTLEEVSKLLKRDFKSKEQATEVINNLRGLVGNQSLAELRKAVGESGFTNINDVAESIKLGTEFKAKKDFYLKAEQIIKDLGGDPDKIDSLKLAQVAGALEKKPSVPPTQAPTDSFNQNKTAELAQDILKNPSRSDNKKLELLRQFGPALGLDPNHSGPVEVSGEYIGEYKAPAGFQGDKATLERTRNGK